MQCHKCKSRYHLFLKCLEGGRSEKVNNISIMMDLAEDFSERDPGVLLAECIGDFLYDDLDHNVVTDIENNADDISCVNLVDKHNDDTCDVYDSTCIDMECRFTVCGLRQYNASLRSTDTKRTALAPSPRRFKFENTIVASLGTATIRFQTTSGELLAYDTDVIKLNVPALFGLLLMRVANADVLVSSMQLRSPIWSAELREHGGHLYVKEKRDIFTSNYLEAGVPDAVDAVYPADKPVVNDDDTPVSTQNRPQKVANVTPFSALSNMHTKVGHASNEAMLRFLEGGILPAGVDSITRADSKRVISDCIICECFGSKPIRPRAAIPSDVKFNESVYIDVSYIDGHPVLSAVCAGTRYTAAGFMVSKEHSISMGYAPADLNTSLGRLPTQCSPRLCI
jgi:hypothetical protein